MFRQLTAEKNTHGMLVAVVLTAEFCKFCTSTFVLKKDHNNEFRFEFVCNLHSIVQLYSTFNWQ